MLQQFYEGVKIRRIAPGVGNLPEQEPLRTRRCNGCKKTMEMYNFPEKSNGEGRWKTCFECKVGPV